MAISMAIFKKKSIKNAKGTELARFFMGKLLYIINHIGFVYDIIYNCKKMFLVMFIFRNITIYSLWRDKNEDSCH